MSVRMANLVKGQQYNYTAPDGNTLAVTVTRLPGSFREKVHVRLPDNKGTIGVWPSQLSLLRGGNGKGKGAIVTQLTQEPLVRGLVPALRPVIPYVDAPTDITEPIIGWGYILGQAVAFCEGGKLYASRLVPNYVHSCPMCMGNGAVIEPPSEYASGEADTDLVDGVLTAVDDADVPDHTDDEAPGEEGAEVDMETAGAQVGPGYTPSNVSITYPGGEPVDDEQAEAEQTPQEPNMEQPVETAPQADTAPKTRKRQKASKLLPGKGTTPAADGQPVGAETLAAV